MTAWRPACSISHASTCNPAFEDIIGLRSIRAADCVPVGDVEIGPDQLVSGVQAHPDGESGDRGDGIEDVAAPGRDPGEGCDDDDDLLPPSRRTDDPLLSARTAEVRSLADAQQRQSMCRSLALARDEAQSSVFVLVAAVLNLR